MKREVLEQMLDKMAEQTRANQELLQNTLRNMSAQITQQAETMTKTVDGRLEQISGKVNERLDEVFKKTNETFASVMARLAVIDEAQKKIDGLTNPNVVSLAGGSPTSRAAPSARCSSKRWCAYLCLPMFTNFRPPSVAVARKPTAY